jgi:DNA-binding LacI/PurR family transcriptional regulator
MVGIDAVAKLAGVSPATASRALSKPDMVAKSTRERVMHAATELKYQPNQFARGLRTRGGRSLGLIITDILNPFHATLAKGVQDAASAQDYTVFLFNTDEDPDKERRALESLRGHLPQGLIVVPTSRTRQHLKLVPHLPVIELDRTSGTPGAHSVLVDNVAGTRAAVEHLIALGHRRIGAIVGEQDITTATERFQGYAEALEAAGIAFRADLVLIGHHREADGRRAATNLLTRPESERPTALFVGNNEMTIGAVLAARDLNLRIPDDLSIVGFDDSRWAQIMQPALSVVAQPVYELGFTACETLLSMLRRDRTPQPTSIRLATTLVQRESTAPPREGQP